ncbi:DUF4037 domain-containing protein [Alteribacter aurantiacus]|uniref:DUF4037 domain-containing protein n=1 Tax=Alteribacter aurantiacus TaxID=254410 RepID=UPI00040FF3B7|nr:DUF4037 domain-containing protein [Alteribacter aurantiacus]
MELRGLASKIGRLYEKNPKVEAVLLGGSVARGWEDDYSDIELFVLWKEGPTDEQRKAPIIESKGTMIDFHPYEDEEWSETYITQGVKLEISNFLTETIHNVLNDVIGSYDTDSDKQCIVATIDHGVALSGNSIIEKMKETVSVYPDELRAAMVNEHVVLGNRWNNREALLEREDWLMLYSVIVGVQANIMGVLFALNRQFVHHPAFKWQKQTLRSMVLTPENIEKRLESILLGHPTSSIKELEAIIEEVYDLVQRQLPQINLSAVLEKSLFLRPKHQVE